MPTIKDTLNRFAGGDPTDDELADRLPVGYRDPKSPAFIPPELRRAVAEFDPKETQAIRRELLRRGSGDVVRDYGRQRHIADPGDSDGELDLVVLWETIRRLEFRRHDAERNATMQAHWALVFGCALCGHVATPSPGGRGVQARHYADGVTAKLCELCHAVKLSQIANTAAAEKLADGRTRDEAVRALPKAKR